MKEKISRNILLSIIAVGVMTFSGVIVETSMNITFPTLIQEFHIGLNVVQWITTIYLLVLSSVIPLSKFLKDNFKATPLFIFSGLMFLIGLIIDASATSFTFLIIGRMIQGIGTGISLPLMFNLILDNVPRSRLGLMMGFGSLITAAASAVGPTFGGIIVHTMGWRYIFIFLIPVLILALLIGVINIPKLMQIKLKPSSFDFVSFTYIILTFADLIIGINNISNNNIYSINVLLPLLIGIITLLLFIRRQNKLLNPILNVSILKSHSYTRFLLAFFINQLNILGLAFVVPNYVQLINHSDSSVAGTILLPGAMLGAIVSPLSGFLLDKVGAKKPIMYGSGIILITLTALTINSSHISNLFFIVAYSLIMLGVGLSYGNIMTKALSYLDEERKADGNAILTTVQQFAGAIGTVIVATIITKVNFLNVEEPVLGFTVAILFLTSITVIQFIIIGFNKD